jgi:ABC-2 type transport system ATP-binding protein
MGYDINKEPLRVRQCIGFTTGGERSLYWKLSARNNLRYFGVLYGMPQERLESRIDELLQLMELKDVEHTRLEKFSHGMRQKVNIARALLHDPPVLLLDEPTLGLDPGFSRFIRRFIKEELNQRQGKTILLTTHYMEEAEQLCDRVAIIDLGEIASVDTPEALKAAMPFERIMQLVVEGEVDDTQLMGITGISPPRVASADGKCTITIQGHGLEEAMDEILGRIRRSAKVLSIRVSEPTLEDVFVHLTGSKLSEPGEGK